MMMNREAREELYDLKARFQMLREIKAAGMYYPKGLFVEETVKQYPLWKLKKLYYLAQKKIEEKEYDPKRKRKRSSWLSFVIAHKNMRTKKGLLDLKAISKLWKLKKTAIRKHK